MKPAVHHIIGKEQKAYTPEKNIGSCIMNIINLMDRTITKKEAGLILLIDFKKTFDSISHKFIYDTLASLNFGKDLISWVRTFLLNRTAQILVGGNLTDAILLEQGVPQGDIISPQLFILMVEILLIKITRSKNIIWFSVRPI